MISDANYRMLVWIRQQNLEGITVTDDAILDSEHHYMRTQKLCDAGLLARAVLVKPGMEKEYPDGLYHYYVTVDGLDAIAEYDSVLQQNAEQRAEKYYNEARLQLQREEDSRKEFRKQCFVAVFNGFTGYVLGKLIEHFIENFEVIKSIFGK